MCAANTNLSAVPQTPISPPSLRAATPRGNPERDARNTRHFLLPRASPLPPHPVFLLPRARPEGPCDVAQQDGCPDQVRAKRKYLSPAPHPQTRDPPKKQTTEPIRPPRVMLLTASVTGPNYSNTHGDLTILRLFCLCSPTRAATQCLGLRYCASPRVSSSTLLLL